MIVAFTGAGISRASGIPTFEERGDLRDVLTRTYWDKKPQLVWDALKEMEQMSVTAKPNPAHLALSKYQIPIVTQNIDGLHQEAGSKTVIEIHGTLHESKCTGCGTVRKTKELTELTKCECGQYFKPEVVLYEEGLQHFGAAMDLVGQADILLVIGTSLLVAPANTLPQMAERNGAKVMVINDNAEEELPLLLNKIG